MKPEKCGDTIKPEKLLWDLNIEQLKTIYSLNSDCNCDACKGMCAMVLNELVGRGFDLKLLPK